MVLFMASVGVWGLISFARGESLGGSFSGALMIGQVLIVIQGIFGLILYIDGPRPSDPVHILYGLTAAIIMPFLYTYLRDRDPRQALFFFSLVALFIFGLGVRGMMTGG